MTNSALQVTNFDFYGNELIIVKDSTTDKTYIPITPALRTLGFTEMQSRHYREKWTNDFCLSKDIVKLRIPTKGGYQETLCLFSGKFLLALIKINITSKMKQTQPALVDKLYFYQVKFNEILANSNLNCFRLHNVSLKTLKNNNKQTEESKGFNRQKHKYSYWRSQMFAKCQMLMDYMKINSYNEIYKQLYREFENHYPEFNLNDVSNEYCIVNNLETCFTMDAIEHNKPVRLLFENMVNNLLEKYGLTSKEDKSLKVPTIFDN